jgi:lipopolysaccharide export system protein LptC
VVLQTKTSVIFLLLACIAVISCSEGKGLSTVNVDAGALPFTHAENVSDLISDSGITRYRLQAKIWDIYSNDTVPYWHFPEGVLLDKYDTLFRVDGSVRADTAYFYEKKDLWRLIGNVFAQNTKEETFETEELFWNNGESPASTHAVYTDKPVKITKGEEIIYARGGLRSNRSMTHYVFYSSGAEVTVNENEEQP